MELHQLTYFVAVAESLNFTRAAERLGVAQPGISAQIRRLEEELGERLFERGARGVRLTPAGEALLPHARAALDSVERGRQAIDELSGLMGGTVRIGMLPSSSFHDVDLPSLLARFRDDHPGVTISLIEARADALVAALERGEADLIFTATAGELSGELETIVLHDEAICAGVARSNTAIPANGISLRELTERPLICLPRGSGIRTIVDRAFSGAGLDVEIAMEASDPSVVAQFASRGLGVALLPRSIVAAFPRALRAVPLIGVEARGQMVVAWRRDQAGAPAARALVSVVRALLTKMPEDGARESNRAERGTKSA
jgi:DNA-binding transcriptional LysR family regulator